MERCHELKSVSTLVVQMTLIRALVSFHFSRNIKIYCSKLYQEQSLNQSRCLFMRSMLARREFKDTIRTSCQSTYPSPLIFFNNPFSWKGPKPLLLEDDAHVCKTRVLNSICSENNWNVVGSKDASMLDRVCISFE
jgi:hypothetical protein